MPEPFDSLPKSLRTRSRLARLGSTGVPALLAHPNWSRPAPFVLWMHGRTAYKELDPGRYNRWLRAGIGCCAIDLPGHGARADEGLQTQAAALSVLDEALREVDSVLDALDGDLFDRERAGIGGMSMGGMVTLRRLCDPHGFRCAAVEGTTGDLLRLYKPPPDDNAEPWPVDHPAEEIERLSALAHLEGPGGGLRPIPLLALHSEADEMVPYRGQAGFLDRLRANYASRGVEPRLIEVRTWAETGAPFEHIGFGRFSAEAKNVQTEFLSRWLSAG